MPHIVLSHITKQFPGVKALDDVSMSIEQGEIHALCGENGAGKSTLMNILSGNLQPDNGGIFLDGTNLRFSNPQQAFAHNIAIVYQHLSLVDSLSVAENIFANQQPVNKWGIIQFDALNHQTSLLLKQLNIEEISPRTLVAELSPAQRQMVEIAKALSKQPSILILDEPTASFTDKETRTLFDILKTLKKGGASIIYISHRLEEIFVLADRISILKDGKHQGTFNASELKKDELITKMVGRELKALRAGSTRTTETLLVVKNISGSRFSNVSFSLHQGEIVGLAGLIGAGRSEIARAIFGIDKIRSGEILFHDKPFHADHPAAAIRERMAYVTEDRKNQGLFQEMTIEENIVAASLPFVMKSGFYDRSKARQISADSKNRFRMAASDLQQRVINLSGGNQQKVMLAKWLLTQPDVLIIDEPTHGIDIGAKYEIYEILKTLAAEGKAILMISSELPELLGLCDRIIVVKKGTVVGEVVPPDMTEEKVIRLAT